jgi:broad specificity phosphatase PhoE
MSQYLGLPIQVLPGLQEIEAGDYEGTPEKDATKGYLVAPIKWVQGDLSARIPGSIDGNEFESRVTAHCRPFTTTVTATPSCSHTAAPSCSGR